MHSLQFHKVYIVLQTLSDPDPSPAHAHAFLLASIKRSLYLRRTLLYISGQHLRPACMRECGAGICRMYACMGFVGHTVESIDARLDKHDSVLTIPIQEKQMFRPK